MSVHRVPTVLPHSLAHCIKVATTVEQLDSQSNCLIEHLRMMTNS